MKKKINKDSYEKKIHKDYYTKKDSGQTLRYKWYIRKFFKNIRNKKFLEIGCGNGGVVQYLKQDNDVYGVDISKNAINFLNKKGIKSYLADLSDDPLPFKKGLFDYVIILETLEHLKSPQKAIEEIQRVLKKNGIMIISIPNPRTEHQLMYPCLFNFKNFKQYLTNNGFSVKTATTYGICPPFWKHLRKIIIDQWKKQKKETNMETKGTKFSQIARLLSNKFFTKIKPKIYGWSFVYECVNINPTGAKELYTEMTNETKRGYN